MQSARVFPLVAWMVLSIASVAALAYWDDRRESTSALQDFAHEQVVAAAAVASAVSVQTDADPGKLLASVRAVNAPGTLLVLLRLSNGALLAGDGRELRSPEIEAAIARGDEWVRLSRPASAALGLPERTSMAGLSGATVAGARYGVVVVATAQRERDREIRASWRLLLAVGIASGLVLAFGGLALRRQRKELELARELAVAEAQRTADERLVRADKLATMGALATGIAHEVSTPLGVIVGRADQLVAKVANDERAKRAVDDILAQSERITRVVRGFLTLARGDAPLLERVGPEDVARETAALVEHRFRRAGVRLVKDLAPELPRIACEPRLLEQAIANLLLNACDACDEGGEVELCVLANGGRVAFVVTDDGEGISAEAAARATEPFFTTKPAGKGTGLGLAIANEIVKHHNGTFSLAPRRDERGTRACVEIPAAG
jgi:signal transduction histidine kinase